jgi:hypothetical protein
MACTNEGRKMNWKIFGALAALCSAVAVAASPASATLFNPPPGCPVSPSPTGERIGLEVDLEGDGINASPVPIFYPAGTEVTLTIRVCSSGKIKDVVVSAYGPGGSLFQKRINLNGQTKEYALTYVVPLGISTMNFFASAASIPYDPSIPPGGAFGQQPCCLFTYTTLGGE